MFHVSYALIFGLKDEAYDEGIIVHVLFGCRDDQVGCACFSDVLPCKGGIQPRSTPPRSLFIFFSQICKSLLLLCKSYGNMQSLLAELPLAML
jgi:hypothetical protein